MSIIKSSCVLSRYWLSTPGWMVELLPLPAWRCQSSSSMLLTCQWQFIYNFLSSMHKKASVKQTVWYEISHGLSDISVAGFIMYNFYKLWNSDFFAWKLWDTEEDISKRLIHYEFFSYPAIPKGSILKSMMHGKCYLCIKSPSMLSMTLWHYF